MPGVSRDPNRIASATGVDVQLDIAGPGSRSYAFLIDWHIRLLLALAWLAAVLLLTGGFHPEVSPSPARAWLVWLPALGIYFFYHPVLELLLRGSTPGKRMAGVRIVTRTGGTPSAGALLIRNVFRLLDCLPSLYCVGLLTTIFTAQKVRIGDLVAGTLLVHTGEDEVKSLAGLARLTGGSGIDAASACLANELLLRWEQLAPERRVRLARQLLARIGPGGAGPGPVDEAGLRARIEALLRGLPAL